MLTNLLSRVKPSWQCAHEISVPLVLSPSDLGAHVTENAGAQATENCGAQAAQMPRETLAAEHVAAERHVRPPGASALYNSFVAIPAEGNVHGDHGLQPSVKKGLGYERPLTVRTYPRCLR